MSIQGLRFIGHGISVRHCLSTGSVWTRSRSYVLPVDIEIGFGRCFWRHAMSTAALGQFDLDPYTAAPLRLEMILEFRGRTPGEVFDVMGDPARITDWYLLAEKVEQRQGATSASEEAFDVTFVFFGRVHEEVLHWDPPHRYVYRAVGPEFPIKDYVAMIEVFASEGDLGTMRWTQHFDVIEGRHFQRILPLIFPPINEESLRQLSPLVGGVRSEVRSHF